MALNAYLTLSGAEQGDIHGSVTWAGREDSIQVNAYNHRVHVPVSGTAGQPSGEHRHSPLIITKEIDKSSPLLMRALINNELILNWRLDFWRAGQSGQEVNFFTIELENARITDIRSEMLNNKDPEHSMMREREHVNFIFQKITWTWNEDGTVTEDDHGLDLKA